MQSKDLVKELADSKCIENKDIKNEDVKVKPEILLDTTRDYLKKVGETDLDMKEYMSAEIKIEIKFEDGVDCVEPENKKLKVKQTSDTIKSYERHDDNTTDEETSRKQIRVENKCENKTEQKIKLKSYGGMRYSCDQCDYKARQKGSLKTHIESVHGGVRYPCEKCNYQATKKINRKTHIESVHGDVRYTCVHCNFKAKWKHHLKAHIESVHGDVRYTCDQCEYKATQIGSLKRNI